MPVSKIKNLIILVLSAAFLFLLALVIPNRLAQSRQQKAQQEQLIALFSSYGITLSEDVLPQEQNLYTLELPDAQTCGSALAKTLFKNPVSMQYEAARDGCSYSGDNGSLRYDNSGKLHVFIKDSSETGNLQSGAKNFLKELDYTVYAVSEPERRSAGVFSVSCTQTLFDVPVFSEPLLLTFTNNRLTEMDGYFFGCVKDAVRVDDTLCISCSDALVALLSQRDRIGWVGSAVLSVQQGYRHIDTAASSIRMAPCFRIVTDGGTFYVNGITGEVSAAEEG